MVSVLERAGLFVIDVASSAREGIVRAGRARPGLIVFGSYDDVTPADAVRQAKQLGGAPKVMALLGRIGRAEVRELLAIGADALLLGSPSEDELAMAARRVLEGERFITPALVPLLSGDRLEESAVPGLLSAREYDVLERIARGLSNRAIARDLAVSPETVKSHLARIYRKLGASNRQQALSRAVALGLLT